MKAGRKKQLLTEKETILMNMLWDNGPLFVRDLVALYPEPKPHFNTVATTIRILEGKGYVGHEVFASCHRFYAIARKEDFREKSFAAVVRDFFGNSYKNAVSALVADEKLSVEELKEIIKLVESNNQEGKSNEKS